MKHIPHNFTKRFVSKKQIVALLKNHRRMIRFLGERMTKLKSGVAQSAYNQAYYLKTRKPYLEITKKRKDELRDLGDLRYRLLRFMDYAQMPKGGGRKYLGWFTQNEIHKIRNLINSEKHVLR